MSANEIRNPLIDAVSAAIHRTACGYYGSEVSGIADAQLLARELAAVTAEREQLRTQVAWLLSDEGLMWSHDWCELPPRSGSPTILDVEIARKKIAREQSVPIF